MFEALKEGIRHFFFDIYWSEVVLFVILLIVGTILEQKFNFKRPRKWFLAFNGLICQRVFSVMAYYVPYLDVVNTHVPLIAETHPYLVRIFFTKFYSGICRYYPKIPFLPFLYLLVGYGILVRNKLPKDRLVRFNIMYGVLIITFQGIFHELFLNFTNVFLEDPVDKSEAALLAFLVWVSIFIPCLYRAISGKYEGNHFMREAIEVHLGRDGPDFIWWDRTRKDQAPKKPKK
uniref:hypothetical protein n=1 Tax=Sporochnus bolleanus TaxID=461143 RepID=UPI002E7A9E6B|nr:hypothetical protein V2496_pgp039 [Sporochnus bolleanus]WAM64909.1 hypothetical protein [Sporochnus bolleanus]